MTAAPFASTIVAVALIPVAFFFVHAFLSGKRKNRFHPVTGILAVTWDLTVSIGYMMYRTFGGAVNGSTLQLTPLLNAYFIACPRTCCDYRNVVGNSCSCPWLMATEKENRKPMAWKNSKSPVLHMVVRFSVRRNTLHLTLHDLR